MEDPGTEVLDLISSITSTNIRKVTFVHALNFPISSDWGILDTPLCRLVDQRGCKHEVEVYLRFPDMGAVRVDEPTGEPEIVRSLPRLREKSRMRFVWVGPYGGEHVVHPRSGVK